MYERNIGYNVLREIKRVGPEQRVYLPAVEKVRPPPEHESAQDAVSVEAK